MTTYAVIYQGGDDGPLIIIIIIIIIIAYLGPVEEVDEALPDPLIAYRRGCQTRHTQRRGHKRDFELQDGLDVMQRAGEACVHHVFVLHGMWRPHVPKIHRCGKH